jgi:hypothetical protein
VAERADRADSKPGRAESSGPGLQDTSSRFPGSGVDGFGALADGPVQPERQVAMTGGPVEVGETAGPAVGCEHLEDPVTAVVGDR